jgi:hypothetical protein
VVAFEGRRLYPYDTFANAGISEGDVGKLGLTRFCMTCPQLF